MAIRIAAIETGMTNGRKAAREAQKAHATRLDEIHGDVREVKGHSAKMVPVSVNTPVPNQSNTLVDFVGSGSTGHGRDRHCVDCVGQGISDTFKAGTVTPTQHLNRLCWRGMRGSLNLHSEGSKVCQAGWWLMNAPRFPTYPDDVMREIDATPRQTGKTVQNIKSLQTQLQGRPAI